MTANRMPFAARSAVGGVIGVAPLVVAAVLLTVVSSIGLADKISIISVNVIYAVGLQVYTGSTGVVAFSPLVFAATGGYTAGILAMTATGRRKLDGLPDWLATLPGQQLWVCVLCGVAASVVLGAITLVIPLRLNGAAATVATLALLLVANGVLVGWRGVTGGSGGLAPIPSLVGPGLCLAGAVAVAVLARLFRDSRPGLLLRAAKSQPTAGAVNGAGGPRRVGYAWLLSCAFLGLGGVLQALYISAVSPDTFFLSASFLVVAALVLGGSGSVSGAVTGATLVSIVQLVLRPAEQQSIDIGPIHVTALTGITQLAVVALLLVSMYVFPSGIMGAREPDELWRSRRFLPATSGHR